VAKTEIAKREWFVKIRLSPGETEIINKHYTQLRYRLDVIDVIVTAPEGAQPVIDKIILSGPRILKDGRESTWLSENLYYPTYRDLPDFLWVEVGNALELVKGEVNA
jgi:hypothetical protein